MPVQAGVVAVQGDVSEHQRTLEQAAAAVGTAVETRRVSSGGVLPACDVAVVPGGESTTISRYFEETGIGAELVEHAAAGKPVLATCAGLIVAARETGDDRVQELDLLDVTIERNAFGRQKDSFEASLSVAGLAEPFRAVFIRAPVITDVGPDVEVLARVDGHPVAVQQGSVVGTAFHPELTPDTRMHELALF